MIPSKYNSYLKINQDYYLITNILAGYNDIISRSIYDFLRGEEGVEEDPELLNYFIERGYLVDADLEEDFLFDQKKLEMWHRTIQQAKIHSIIVTYDCNFQCQYCFETHKHGTMRMDFETIDQVFRCIESLDKGKESKNLIGLFGGEPLLLENRDIVRYALAKGNSLGYRYFIPTNGYYLEEYVELLKHYQLALVQVTLDGPARIHDARRNVRSGSGGTFAKIVQGIRKALEHAIPLMIRINVDRENVPYIKELIDFFVQQGWLRNEHFHYTLAPCRHDPGRCFRDFSVEMRALISQYLAPEQHSTVLVHEFVRRLRVSLHNCDACFRQFFYSPDGKIFPCSESIGNSDLVIGEYIPVFRLHNNYNLLVKRNILHHDMACATCKHHPICMGGCPYRAWLDRGSLTERDCGTLREIRNGLANSFK